LSQELVTIRLVKGFTATGFDRGLIGPMPGGSVELTEFGVGYQSEPVNGREKHVLVPWHAVAEVIADVPERKPLGVPQSVAVTGAPLCQVDDDDEGHDVDECEA
jgi:hypothetical protein